MKERDELRVSVVLSTKAATAVSDGTQADLQAKEEAVFAALAECQQLVDQAYAHGCGRHFFTALKSLERKEAESKVAYLQAQIEKLTEKQAEGLLAEKAEAEKAVKKAAEEEKKAYNARCQEALDVFASAAADRAEIEEAKASMEEQLKERREALESFMAQLKAAWEFKLKRSEEALKALNDAWADGGLSVKEITEMFLRTRSRTAGKELLPFLLNELEDEINQGLIYFVPNGETKVKQLDPQDGAPGIKLDHSCIKAHHATFSSKVPGNIVTLRADDPTAVISLDGQRVCHGDEPRLVSHGSRIIFGSQFHFKFVDPRFIIGRSATKDALSLQIAQQELGMALPGAMQDFDASSPTKPILSVVPSGGYAKTMDESQLRARIQELEGQLEAERRKKCCTVM